MANCLTRRGRASEHHHRDDEQGDAEGNRRHRQREASPPTLALIDAGHIELEPNTAFIREEDCSGCKSCVPLCPYKAISFLEDKKKAWINEALCKGCGTCVAACPSGSIVQNLFEDEEVFSEIQGVLAYD